MALRALKRFMKREILGIAAQATATPLTLKYVPAMPGVGTLLVPPPLPHVRDERELPIPPRELWIGYGQTADEYVASGAENVGVMRDLLKRSGYEVSTGQRVLDFGCGAGRMLRHFASEAANAEFWGADISAEHILWANRHLRPPFRFVMTTTLPHVPFPDGYFHLVYAGSVFTHIADLADAWLLEVRRIIAPGGRAFLTFHDSHTLRLLDGPQVDAPLTRRLVGAPRSGFGLLAIDRWPEYGGTQVFYSDEYLMATLTAVFRVLAVHPEAHGYQTAAIVTRI